MLGLKNGILGKHLYSESAVFGSSVDIDRKQYRGSGKYLWTWEHLGCGKGCPGAKLVL